MATRRYALITFDLDDTLWMSGPCSRARGAVEQWMRTHCPRVPERFDRAALMALRKRSTANVPSCQHASASCAWRPCASRCARPPTTRPRRSGWPRRPSRCSWREARHRALCRRRLRARRARAPLRAGRADQRQRRRVPPAARRHFRFAFSAETLGASKPAPEHFEACAAGGDVPPARGVARRRSLEHDVLGARRAGMTAVWFNREGREP